MGSIITKIVGTKSEREIKKILPVVREINRIYETLHDLPDDWFINRTAEFKQMIKRGVEQIEEQGREEGWNEEQIEERQMEEERKILDEILPEAYAMVKEVCRRLVGQKWKVCDQPIVWDMIPYDVQLIGAVVLHQGKIAEMKTGEGKTLVATMPLYLNALTGRGAHLVTVNDYLAKRDSQWMGRIYERLGLKVGCILNDMNNEQRKEQYSADVTYGTNNEFGFDYLRDNMAITKEEQVQRGHYYAIVDEVDSVLIDEARTPLIISGVVSSATHQKFTELKPKVEALVKKQTHLVNRIVAEAERLLKEGNEYEAGIKLLQARRGAPKNKRLQKLYQEPGVKKLERHVENDFMRDKRMHEIDEELFFSIDEHTNITDLTEKGRQELAPDNGEMFVIPDLVEEIQKIDEDGTLSKIDKERRKEKIQRLYSERSEQIHNIIQLLKAYSLFEKDVEYVVTDGKVLIVDEFTGRILPGRRYSDGLHQALEAKENVRIERETQTIATITLQNYFRLYEKLAGMTGTAETEAAEFHHIYKLEVVVIPTNKPVIRIDYDDMVYKTRREKYRAVIDEIEELYNIGRPVLVGTISVEVSETLSRMLKRRGIPHNVLNAKHHQREAEIIAKAGEKKAVTIATNMAGRGTDIKLGEGVVDLGGLHIIGTERHESRRIDLQLRGRSGRQGDPGSSKFYLSLEDDLMRLFGSDRIASIMDKLGVQEGEVITHGMITKSIERAQKKVEARNFSIRKHLLEYDDVMNQQREVVYNRRNYALAGGNLQEEVIERLHEFVDRLIEDYTREGKYPEEWDWNGLETELMNALLMGLPIPRDQIEYITQEELRESIINAALGNYRTKEELIGSDMMRQLERFAVLRVIDEHWKDHLYELDQLKEGISLRAYGQKDPLIEYKTEAFNLFIEMLHQINRDTLKFLFRAQIAEEKAVPRYERDRRHEPVSLIHQSAMGMGFQGGGEEGGDGGSAEPRRIERGGKKQPVVVGKKVGRNEPCPCGSGKKYKKCCGR
ncbi:MAG: preprotein translocase subunit SecA [Fidelibacterota bacterium]